MTKEIHLGRARGGTSAHTQKGALEQITFGRRGILINPQSLNLKDRKLTVTHRTSVRQREWKEDITISAADREFRENGHTSSVT